MGCTKAQYNINNDYLASESCKATLVETKNKNMDLEVSTVGPHRLVSLLNIDC